MSTLILLRHGESMWNKKNLFTGWVDVPLSKKGVQEALDAGKTLSHTPIDVIFCGTLIRGIETAMLVMSEHESHMTPVIQHKQGKLKSWGKIYSESAQSCIIPVFCHDALNERMYGKLQGLNKRETMDTFGEEQVKLWRRSFAVKPPSGESLELTTKRAIPYFKTAVIPWLKKGKNVLIAAHGNSLRACVKFIENLSDEEIVSLEIATGDPLIYTLTNDTFSKRQ